MTQNKSFLETAFSKNAKRMIQHKESGAYALTGRTGSGKTTLLKELILLFEEVYSKSTNGLEMFLFDGKGNAFEMFDDSIYIAKRSATLKDLGDNEQVLHPLTSALKVPTQITNSVGEITHKFIIIDECSVFQRLAPSDVKYLYWLVEHAKEHEMTVIIADQLECLDIFNSPSMTKFIRMVDFRTFKIRNSNRLIDVPYLSDDEFIEIQSDYQRKER